MNIQLETKMLKYCCQELERIVLAPTKEDQYIITYIDAPGFGWMICDRTEEDGYRDTYTMDECPFCKNKMELR